MSNFKMIVGDWSQLAEHASKIRFEVFVQEQKVPEEMELDEYDAVSVHVLVFDQDEPVATGRLLPDGHIGRMAVAKSARGKGVGAMVLQRLIDEGKEQGFTDLVLSAQTHAMGFYAKFGFVPEGEVYMDAGIEHKDMRLRC